MRLIDADALVKDIEEYQKSMVFHSYGERMHFDDMIDFAIDHIEDAPAIDAVPVVHEKDIRSSVITVKDSDGWQDRIILADESTQVCAVYYSDDSERVPVVRCRECKHWGTGVSGEIEGIKCCKIAGYMVAMSGYCVYGEKSEEEE